MDSISESTIDSYNPLINSPSRIRKVSVDNQTPFQDVDMNGNTPLRKRLSNCSEDPVPVAQLQGVLMDAITKSRESASSDARASGAWEQAFIEHIQGLIESVKVTDTLSSCINDELQDNSENTPENTSIGRVRKNNCFAVNRSTSYKNAILGGGGRRVSVTEREQNGPRRKVSVAGLENMNMCRRNSGFPGEGRRNSVTSKSNSLERYNGGFASERRRNSLASKNNSLERYTSGFVSEGRRNSVASKSNSLERRNGGFASEGRRNSVASKSNSLERHNGALTNLPPTRRCSVVVGPGRRNSFVTSVRRNSVAHAPGFGPPPLRKLSSAHNVLDTNMNNAPRRRSSVVKPSCFSISKISSLQQRLHRIYRQRRRKQRGQVNIADVKTAMRVDRGETSDNSGGQTADSESDNSIVESDNSAVESDTNVVESDNAANRSENDSGSEQSSTNTTRVNANETDENCNLGTTNNLNCSVSSIDRLTDMSERDSSVLTSDDGGSPQGPIPSPRRKTSIQIRSWEISRQLRQRRRQKRKSGTESDLI